MKRHTITPRPDWEQIVEKQGLSFYLTNEKPYWDESVCYEFSTAEIDALETATYALNEMCLQAVEYAISHNLWEQFLIPREFEHYIRSSWKLDEHTIYGRFDFAFDGSMPKLLEYNADTPTGLIEAAVIQWFWLQDFKGGNGNYDQFNSIHERLIEAWQHAFQDNDRTVYFASINDQYEDYMTTQYLRDTALQAGLDARYIEIGDIGWNDRLQMFVAPDEQPLNAVFKLYPWEWLINEEFGQNLRRNTTRWLEPPWKMLLSNKALLPLLYQLFPQSPYVLPAQFKPLPGDYVEKPILGREGANTKIIKNGSVLNETDGPYNGPVIYQEYTALPAFDGNVPVLGSWMVNGYACGIGIREESNLITTNQSRFVPHFFITG